MTEYNRKISEILFEIECKKSEQIINKAYCYVDEWCDNDECYNGEYYDFTNAVWGVGEETIIAYLEGLLKE